MFLSTAFLTSLGVTVSHAINHTVNSVAHCLSQVLIVYVMNPPVRVAVQGAYLVAIFFTGITFGALSIVFKELTEGLGCLLGGFCLSMWLLSLKPGGLLTDDGSKSGFIGAISVGIYALSFTHHTRPYALIGSTAAAGGTAVALGIDCFSRAGLKEFWLYIWGKTRLSRLHQCAPADQNTALNEDIFPLNTNTYPVTRNIRVELAATVIVAILGVISQLRLWNVVRERRRKEEELRAEEQRKKEEAEAEIGRQLEENNLKERLAWEARYNSTEPDIPELGSNSKTCLTDEKAELRKAKEIDCMTVSSDQSSTSEASYRCSDCREREANGESAYAPSVISESTGASQTGMEDDDPDAVDRRGSQKSPTPLKVFDGAAAARMKDDNGSEVTAIIGSETGTIRSKRFSGRSILHRMSVRSSLRQMSESQEALVSCADGASLQDDVDDDLDGRSEESEDRESARKSVHDGGAHSDSDTEGTSQPMEKRLSCPETASDVKDIAAKTTDEQSVYSREVEEAKDGRRNNSTVQEANDQRCPSESPKEIVAEQKDEQVPEQPPPQKSAAEFNPIEAKDEKRKSDHIGVTEANDSSSSAPEGSSRSLSPTDQSKRSSDSKGSTQKEEGSSSNKRRSESTSTAKAKAKKEPAKLNANTVKQLPQRDSIVVQSYRTNEWAKHLADAEILEPEPIEPIEEEEPEIPVGKEEAPAPVNVEELLQTPLTAQPPPAAELHASLGRTPSINEHYRTSGESQSRRDSQSTKRGSRSKRVSGLSSVPTPDALQPLTPDAQPQPVPATKSGAYHAPTPLSPIADAVEQPREEVEPKPQWVGPPPLIAVREGMVQNKLTSFSLGTDPWSSRLSPGLPSMTRSSSALSTNPVPEDEDNMPLSRRRTMLHQQTQRTLQTKASPLLATGWSQSNPTPIAGPTAAVLSRRTSTHDGGYHNRNSLSRNNSGAKIGASPYVLGQQQRSSSSINIDQAIAQGMQRGDMSNLHRDAMRRMQAKANQKVNGR